MDIRFHAERTGRSERARARVLREGRTPRGHLLWTPMEDQIFRELYPDYRAIKRRLRRRSMPSLRARAGILKLTTGQSLWTAKEVSQLRRRWRDASRAELMSEFSRHSWISIQNKGRTFGIKRRPWMNPRPTGNSIVDKIRLRAIELKLSMRDLDEMFNGGREYFVKCSRGVGVPRSNLYLKTIEALGGHIEIVWR
jgi:hypothetical protein